MRKLLGNLLFSCKINCNRRKMSFKFRIIFLAKCAYTISSSKISTSTPLRKKNIKKEQTGTGAYKEDSLLKMQKQSLLKSFSVKKLVYKKHCYYNKNRYILYKRRGFSLAFSSHELFFSSQHSKFP